MSDKQQSTRLRELVEDALPILAAVLEDREQAQDEEDEILRDLIARMREALADA